MAEELVLDKAAVRYAAALLYGWECSPYVGRFVFDELSESAQATRLYDAALVIRAYLTKALPK